MTDRLKLQCTKQVKIKYKYITTHIQDVLRL